MASDDRTHGPQRLQRGAQGVADIGVPLHQLEFFGRQPARLEQHGVGHTHLAHVVQVAAPVQSLKIGGRQPERLAKRHGLARQSFAMPVGRGVARFDGQRQRHEGRLGRIEHVQHLLHARQRADPCPQLHRMHGLRQKLVGARLDALDAIRSSLSPVTSTTGVNRVAGSAFRRRQTSRPSSLGIPTSRRTTSG